MKYAFIRTHQAGFGVMDMCWVLQFHFSGFYAWFLEPLTQIDRPPKSRSASH